MSISAQASTDVESDDDLEWAERSEYWLRDAVGARNPLARRQRRKEPLVLCGHGASMRIEDRALVIRDGFSHYPQKKAGHRFFRGDNALPPRIIMVDGSGSLTFDVLTWLAEQGVALVHIDWKGDVVSVFSGNGYAADRKKVQWQTDTRADDQRRMAFSTSLIIRKIAASIETLETVIPPSRKRDAAVAKAIESLARLKASAPADMTALRLIEAVCASAYFGAWREVGIKWKATTRRPVPDDWRLFTSRTSLGNGGKLLNVNASHPVNAMLNYAYGVLEARLRIETIADGYDPTIGIMHNGRREKSAYVFDLMEPERPKVDAAILTFVADHTFSAADFIIREDGVCRLSPQLARRVCEVSAY